MRRGSMMLALLIGGVASALAAPPAVQITTLDNGLRAVLAPDPEARAVDVAVWYPTGPAVEKPGQSGITHVFERLMFRGTESRGAGEYRRLLEAEGAGVNTLTTPDFTSYFATVPEGAVDLALQLESERMTKLRFTAADLEADRGLALSERRSLLEANPVGLGVEKLYATAFPGHGYGRPVLGLENDLRRISFDDAQEYYRDRYGPNHAVLTVVGRFDPQATLAAIRRDFGSLPRRGAAVEPAPLPPPAARGSAATPGRVPVVLVGWRAPGSADAATASLEILARVLGSGSQGRLSGGTSNPLVMQARAGFDPARAGSFLYAFASLRSGADSSAVERFLIGAVEGLADEAVAAEELDRAKRDWELDWLAAQQTVRGRARAIGTALLVDGDVAAPAKRLEAIRNLTPADLQDTARKLLRPEARSVVWLTPAAGATVPDAAGKNARGSRR